MSPLLAQVTSDTSSDIPFWAIAMMIGFYFAVIVAIIVYRRGQKRWAGWTALSAIIPFVSIVVPILALRQGRPEPVVLAEPCPECGGVTGYADAGLYDKESCQRVPHVVTAIISGALGIGLAIGSVLLAISIWAGGDQSCSGGFCIEWENGAVIAGIGFLGLGLWLASLAGNWATTYIGADKVEGIGYRCAGCDKRWVSFETGHLAAV